MGAGSAPGLGPRGPQASPAASGAPQPLPGRRPCHVLGRGLRPSGRAAAAAVADPPAHAVSAPRPARPAPGSPHPGPPAPPPARQRVVSAQARAPAAARGSPSQRRARVGNPAPVPRAGGGPPPTVPYTPRASLEVGAQVSGRRGFCAPPPPRRGGQAQRA